MSSQTKRIAIVGGGLTGLGAIVALKEVGLDPVCFETTDSFGGFWCYREESLPGTASVMSTTIASNSKEMGAASDFPPPKECSPYMSHRELLRYAKMYMEAKGCEKHFRFNSEVTLVQKAADYDESGRFGVTVKDRVTGQTTTDVFDGVVIATGHSASPKMVTFEGQDKFKGTIMHTHSLKTVKQFKGKSVLIVGNGCSCLDAAEMISSVAKNVYLSSRSGFIALTRQGPSGYPLDHILLRRYLSWILHTLPLSISNWYIETFYADVRFDHHLYRVPPKYHVLSKDPIFNDAIGSRLLSGTVVQKAGVRFFTENGATFEGEDQDTEVDAIVLATDYESKFPFLDEGLLEIEDGRINLYRCMYPVDLAHGSLVFLGFVSPFGPDMPVGEMQCRLAAQVFAGSKKLPSRQGMLEEVRLRHERNLERYAPCPIITNRIDFMPYMDELAAEIGCKPSLAKYCFTDFPLFLRLVFGPILPYQYRLEGPFKWDGAREAIFTSQQRLLYPLIKDNIPRKGITQLLFEFLGNLIPSHKFNF